MNARIIADPVAIAAVIAEHPAQARAVVAGLLQAVGVSAVLAAVADLTKDAKVAVRRPIVYLPKPARHAVVSLPNYTVQQRFERWARTAIASLPEAERAAAVARAWTEGLERSKQLQPPMTVQDVTTVQTAIAELSGPPASVALPAEAPPAVAATEALPAPKRPRTKKASTTVEVAGTPAAKPKARKAAG